MDISFPVARPCKEGGKDLSMRSACPEAVRPFHERDLNSSLPLMAKK
jgi:hypothetical protein